MSKTYRSTDSRRFTPEATGCTCTEVTSEDFLRDRHKKGCPIWQEKRLQRMKRRLNPITPEEIDLAAKVAYQIIRNKTPLRGSPKLWGLPVVVREDDESE